MAGECGGWTGGRVPVLAPAAEISCDLPGPPLRLWIKPRRNRKGLMQVSRGIEAEKREKHQRAGEVI